MHLRKILPFEFNDRLFIYFLVKYLEFRKTRWHSLPGYFLSFYRDDEPVKTAECHAMHEKYKSLVDKMKEWDLYLLVVDKEDASYRNGVAKQLIQQNPIKHAYIFITDHTGSLYCLMAEDGKIDETEITITLYPLENEETAYESETETAQTTSPSHQPHFLITEIKGNLAAGGHKKISYDDLQRIIEYSNYQHDQSRQVAAITKFCCDLGLSGRQHSVLSANYHAGRTYFIDITNNSYLKEEFDRQKNIERKACEKFWDEYIKLGQQTEQLMLEDDIEQNINKAIEAEKNKFEEYRSSLLKLADLGDEKAIIHASKIGLFSLLPFPNLTKHPDPEPQINKINKSKPYGYQRTYYRIHNAEFYQTLNPINSAPITFEQLVSHDNYANLPKDLPPNECKNQKSYTTTVASFFGLSTSGKPVTPSVSPTTSAIRTSNPDGLKI